MNTVDPDATDLCQRLHDRCPDAVIDVSGRGGNLVIRARLDAVEALLIVLRDDEPLAFTMLIDLTAVDRLGAEDRFELVYQLFSPDLARRVRIRVAVGQGDDPARSVTSIYPSADWLEREIHDLFGIRFENHPDLRPLLLDPDFPGHPLRKDHPHPLPESVAPR